MDKRNMRLELRWKMKKWKEEKCRYRELERKLMRKIKRKRLER